jgi:hypothetical protein
VFGQKSFKTDENLFYDLTFFEFDWRVIMVAITFVIGEDILAPRALVETCNAMLRTELFVYFAKGTE